MRFRSCQRWFPKDVNSPLDYEDASACSAKAARVVIADGVSTAIFSRTWARLLTRTAVVNPPNVLDSHEFNEWLRPLQQEWRQAINFGTVARDWIRGPKVTSVGAQSTLLIVELQQLASAEDGKDGTCEYRLVAHAIGDCCLFVIRGGTKILSFPMTDAAAFAAGPHVLSSIAKDAEYVDKFQHLDERCREGDLLVLCTDAVGLWAMQEYEAGNDVDWMRYWENDTAWQADILELRARSPKDPRNRMRVDDCTLMLLQVTAETQADDEPDLQPDLSDEAFVLIQTADEAERTSPKTPKVGLTETEQRVESGDGREQGLGEEPSEVAADVADSGPPVVGCDGSCEEKVVAGGSSEVPIDPMPPPDSLEPTQHNVASDPENVPSSVWGRLFGSRKRLEP